jgi:hypothetical protein
MTMGNEIRELSFDVLDGVVGGGGATMPGKDGVSSNVMTNTWNNYFHEFGPYMLWNQFFREPTLPDQK